MFSIKGVSSILGPSTKEKNTEKSKNRSQYNDVCSTNVCRANPVLSRVCRVAQNVFQNCTLALETVITGIETVSRPESVISSIYPKRAYPKMHKTLH